MHLERDHLVLLVAGALVGAGLASVLPGLGPSSPPPETRPERSPVETVRQRGIAHVAGGQADAALPLLPLGADGNGTLHGRTDGSDPPAPGASLRDWHRPCLPKGGDALPDPETGPAPLRYLDPGEADVDDPYRGSEPWYAGRHGDPVHAGDLPAGRPAYAAWADGSDPGARDPLVVLLKMNASARSGDHDPFTRDGILAFAARAPPACRLVAVAPDVPPDGEAAGVREAVEGHPRLAWPPEPEVAVDPVAGDVWDPSVVVDDLARVLTSPPEPTP